MIASPSKSRIVPVILCGGQGARLWPRSRADRPKPFLPLLGERTLFQQTIDRCSDRAVFTEPIFVAGENHVELVVEQTGELRPGALIVEPEGRNTAPAIALAAARLDPDAIMLVCPSDHFVADRPAFLRGVASAATLAASDWLVSLATTPDRPETGYGYMAQGQALDGGWQIDRFVEKPDFDQAMEFLVSGQYHWNSGIFVFRSGAFLAELARHRPAMVDRVMDAVTEGIADGATFRPAAGPFSEIESVSVDKALMEKTSRAALVPVAMGWSDIGNWASLGDAMETDAGGNAISGPAELVDCENVLVTSDGPRVSAVGLKDICVIVDGNEVLVTARDAVEHVGNLQGARKQ